MQKAYFFSFIFGLCLLAVCTPVHSKRATRVEPAKFSLVGAIEEQATRDLYRLASEINKTIFKKIKRPEEPTKIQKSLDAFADSILKWRGSKLEKVGKVCAWCTIVLPICAGIIDAADIGKEKLKMVDHVAYAGYSLGLLAAQTYLLEKVGVSTKKDLTIKNVIDYAKKLIRTELVKQNDKKEALKKLQESREKLPHAKPEQLKEHIQQQDATIATLQEQLMQFSQKAERSQVAQPTRHML